MNDKPDSTEHQHRLPYVPTQLSINTAQGAMFDAICADCGERYTVEIPPVTVEQDSLRAQLERINSDFALDVRVAEHMGKSVDKALEIEDRYTSKILKLLQAALKEQIERIEGLLPEKQVANPNKGEYAEGKADGNNWAIDRVKAILQKEKEGLK